MKQLKRTTFILMIFILLSLTLSSIIFAADSIKSTDDVNIAAIKTNSPSCLLMDAKTGEILYAKNAYDKMYPASTTKLMTAILTLENCKLTDTATVSHNAIYSIPVGYSHASLKEGEILSIEQLLNVLLIPSANDAAVVLAEHISGSVEEFSRLMNNKAKELGCQNTHFVNPNGIHSDDHYSTAYDLSLIGRYAMKFSDIMRIAMIKQYTLPTTNKYDKTDRIFNATNALINNESLNKNYYPYATGLKTGYTDSAGSCIVSTAKKDNMELLVVILNASSIDSRYKDCINLFDYGFNTYSYTTIHSPKDIVKSIEIANGTKETKNLDIAVKDDITVLLEKNFDLENLTPNIEIQSDLKAPLAENTIVGKISYTINGKEYSSDLIADSSVIPSSFEVIIFRILLIFLILYIIYRLLRHDFKKSSSKNSRNYKTLTKRSSKAKKKDYSKSRKSRKMITNTHTIHNGKGEFKFTQINDYLS